MTISNKKIQGFVVLNINTDEYSFLKTTEEQNSGNVNANPIGRLPSNNIIHDNKLPITLENLSRRISVPEEKITNSYIYGSRAYGTGTVNSDWDIITVADIQTPFQFIKFSAEEEKFEVLLYNKTEILNRLNENDIQVLEILYYPESFALISKETYDVNINQSKLINKTLEITDKEWKDAKIYINNGENVYKGRKKVFHMLRHYIMAEQILKYGKIIDFNAANSFYPDIIDSEINDFSYFETNYTSIRNHFKMILENYLNEQIKTGSSIANIIINNGPISRPPLDISFDVGVNTVVNNTTVSEAILIDNLNSENILIGNILIGDDTLNSENVIIDGIIDINGIIDTGN